MPDQHLGERRQPLTADDWFAVESKSLNDMELALALASANLGLRRSDQTPARGPSENDERLRLALEMANLGTYHRDIASGTLHYSPEVAAILGLAPEPFEESLEAALARVHPEDREWMAATSKRNDTTATARYEYRVIRADGEIRWVSVASRILRTPAGSPETALAVMADITQQRNERQALIENEEQMRLAVETAELATWRRDLRSDTFYYSDRAAELFGLPRQAFCEPMEEAIQRVHPADRGQMLIEMERLRLDGGMFGHEFRVLRPNGAVRWARHHTRVLHDAEGHPSVAVSVARDITEERAAAAAVQESRERVELALGGADLGTWDTDFRAGTISMDARSASLMNRPGELRLHAREQFSFIHPDDVELDRGRWIAHLKGDTESYESEYRLANPDGTWRWIRSRGRVIARDDDGRALRAAGTHMDVTAQNEAIQRLSEAMAETTALSENSRDCIVILDQTLNIVRLNGQARHVLPELCGHEPQLGTPLLDSVPPEIGDVLRGQIALVFATRQPAGLEIEIPRLGRPVPHEFEFVPIILPDGSVRGLGITTRDVSARKRNEAIVAQTQQLESLGRLVGGVAHDFNNLLGVIRGFSELAVSSIGEANPAADDIREVISAAESAAGLTRQLLAFARRQHTEPCDVDLNELIRKVEKLLRRVIGEDITLSCALTNSPLIAYIDPGQFEQVIINMAVNARDAMPEGGRLRISARPATTAEGTEAGIAQHEGAAGWAVVEIEDSGTGMPREILDHVFEPFFTTKEPSKGTGLGLATCHGIVSQAGGTISVASEIGRGTTFRIYLPQRDGGAVAHHKAAATPAIAPAGRRERVLLIEDKDELRAVVARILAAAGYDVHSAANPIQAIEIASTTNDIALIVSDLVMPVMDGVQLFDILTTLLGAKPVVFVSGYAESSLIESALTRPNAHFLPKPFAPSALAALAHQAIGRPGLDYASGIRSPEIRGFAR